MKLKLTKILSLPILICTSVPFIVSCSSSGGVDNAEHSNAYKLIKSHIDANKKMFQNTKTIANEKVKGIVEIKNNSFETFKQVVETYFELDSSFNELLTKNNNEIYKQIKQINIQPFPNSKDVNVIIFIGSSTEDKDVISEKVLNVLTNNFAYSREFEISKKSISQIEMLTAKEFQDLASSITNNVDKKIELLRKGFNIQNLSIIENNITSLIIEINSANYRVSISIKKEDIEKGFIIKDSSNANNSYWTKITSNPIAKND